MGRHKRSRRARSRSSSHSSTEGGRRVRSRSSRSTIESIDRFTEAITALVQKSTLQGHNMNFKGDTLPQFDPDDRNQSSVTWCKKVDELRSIFSWSDDATVYFAMSKLKGMAEVWYKGLRTLKYSWDEWKQKLQEAFPSKKEYHDLLGEMMRRKKKAEESYTKYFYEKVALLNACEIEGTKAVSCIIGGMEDRIVKTGAKAGQYETPESLYRYLSSLNETPPLSHQAHHPKSNYKRNKSFGNHKRQNPSPKEPTCFKCGKVGHFANQCSENSNQNQRCKLCGNRNHDESRCFRNRRAEEKRTVALLEATSIDPLNLKYYKDVVVNNIPTKGYIDFGSSCTIITADEAQRLNLEINSNDRVTLHGYGNGVTSSMGSTIFKLRVDEVEGEVKAVVVSNHEQDVPILIGRSFTELPHIKVIKSSGLLQFFNVGEINKDQAEISAINIDPSTSKTVLRSTDKIIVPANHISTVEVSSDKGNGDYYVEASLRPQEGRESCVPRTVLRVNDKQISLIRYINLSDQDIVIKKGEVVARAFPCEEENKITEKILNLKQGDLTELNFDKINVGPISNKEKQNLFKLLSEFRDCFAQNISELGSAKTAQMEIRLNEDKPFCYRPYRMSKSEQEAVKEIVGELLENGIVRESSSNFASPVVLVKKKNGENRLCIDYRKLNSLTVKDNHPLPRIDDQIDRLQGGIYFTSLDLRSGYHQIPMAEDSKRYTAFVTPSGQYEYNRMPFGLTNAPRTFQRFITRILTPIENLAAVYLDDVLLHARSVPEALDGLRRLLQILREEGLTLNLEKCSFMMTSVTFLGFEISQGKVQPGMDKIQAVENFKTPQSLTQIRQFLGLTGYFRQFVKNYGIIARPLTALLRKNTAWKWTKEEEKAFKQLQGALISRPVLAIFNPDARTEVHTDASSLGLAGILLQYQGDERLHPVAYFSRQTTDLEHKFHSYELETLAVVESLKKFRVYLLGTNFTVVTDCNALKATSEKKQLIPRIARWWLQLQEFSFEVKYRPGNRMKHVDALSRNPIENPKNETIMRITQDDWVLAGQLTDTKIKEIRKILSRPPTTEYEKNTYKNYALRNGRVYRITARGIQWVVPRGMRQQIVKAAHDDMGHFALEKTLRRLCEHYWFPRMREYVEKYIACCIRCLYNKRKAGKKEGYLHPIPKNPEPMKVIHVDHLGPFPKSRRGNQYIITSIDGFTKFSFLRAIKSTKTKAVIEFFKDIFSVYGTPKVIISDQGSSFTSKEFSGFCKQNNIHHILNAVATPRANGQVERLNRVILSALLTTTLEEDRWDEKVRQVQFAINSTINNSTGKTPTELLFGYIPRGGSDLPLNDEIQQTSQVLSDLVKERSTAAEKIIKAQEKQKKYFDRKRKRPKKYKEGDVVLVEKNEIAPNTSRKLLPPYSGPFVVKSVLPHDRYVIQDMEGSHRTSRRPNYERIIAVDRLKPWCLPGGVSDDTTSDSGEDGVVLSDEDVSEDKLEASCKQDGRM